MTRVEIFETMLGMVSPKDHIWLVRSSGKVVGPYSANEIIRKIRARELSLLDEAGAPQSRWFMLRDHPVLKQLLAQLLEEILASDDATANTDVGTQSLTDSLSEKYDELTQKINQSNLDEIIVDQINEIPSSASRPGQGRFQDQVQGHRIIQEQADRGSIWLWVMTIAIFIGVGGGIWWKRNLASRSAGGLDAIQVGMSHYSAGEYSKALGEFRKISSRSEKIREISIPLGLLLIHESQTAEARRLLGQIDQRQSDYVDAQLAFALADLKDGDLRAALEKLKNFVQLRPDRLDGKVNLGLTYLELGQTDEALAEFQGGLDRGHRSIFLLLGYFFASLNTSQDTGEQRQLQEASRLLEAMARTEPLFSFDAQLALLMGELQLKGDGDVEARIRKMMDSDLPLYEERIDSLFYHPDFLIKALYGKGCISVADSLNASDLGHMLRAICNLRLGQLNEARRQAEVAVNQSPKSVMAQSIYAYVLRRTGQADEASLALGRALELDRRQEFFLPHVLQGRFCIENEDWECARKQWQIASDMKEQSPSVDLGLAQVAQHERMQDKAREHLNRIRSFESTYKPLKVHLRGLEKKS